MKQILIVDGYNIIGAWSELQQLKAISLEEARDRLIDALADYRSFSGLTVYVVFDAHQVPGPGGKYVQNGVEVHYTREKETADERIERLVTELQDRRTQIYVATSDMTEQHVVFGRGALRVSARELSIQVEQCRKELRRKLDETAAPTRNTFDSKLTSELRALFEKWRRGG